MILLRNERKPIIIRREQESCDGRAGAVPESTCTAARVLTQNLKEDYTMSVDTVNEKVQELRELKRMREEFAVEITNIEDELKGHMTAAGMDTLLGMDWKITWKAVTSNRLDSAALKKELPEIAARFMKQTTARRFVLA